jgi:hypothetical protein
MKRSSGDKDQQDGMHFVRTTHLSRLEIDSSESLTPLAARYALVLLPKAAKKPNIAKSRSSTCIPLLQVQKWPSIFNLQCHYSPSNEYIYIPNQT